jgi:hypothetical protein
LLCVLPPPEISVCGGGVYTHSDAPLLAALPIVLVRSEPLERPPLICSVPPSCTPGRLCRLPPSGFRGQSLTAEKENVASSPPCRALSPKRQECLFPPVSVVLGARLRPFHPAAAVSPLGLHPPLQILPPDDSYLPSGGLFSSSISPPAQTVSPPSSFQTLSPHALVSGRVVFMHRGPSSTPCRSRGRPPDTSSGGLRLWSPVRTFLLWNLLLD